jgi:EAL domain-containing protein (putative c-di-GMP-specific phosphodiesterase class I)
VENAQQLICLSTQPCDEAQGYLFSRPVPPGTFEAMLRDRAPFLVPKPNPAFRKAHGH